MRTRSAITVIAALAAAAAIFSVILAQSWTRSQSNVVGQLADNMQEFMPAAETNDSTTSASSGAREAPPLHTWRCEAYFLVDCHPVTSSYEGYLVHASTEKIYDVESDSIRYVEGRYGESLRLRAFLEDYVDMDGEFGRPPFTVAFWVKADPSASNYGHIVSHVNGTMTEGWYFDITDNRSAGFTVVNLAGEKFTPARITVPAQGGDEKEEWTHVAGTFDGEVVRLYKDGALAGELPFAGEYRAPSGIPLRIGNAAYCQICASWGGEIDDLYIFGRALGADEMARLYSGTLEEPGRQEVVGHWPFDGTLGDSSSPGGHDGRVGTIVAGLASAPDGRIFFTEKNTGRIRTIVDDRVLEKPFATVPDLKVDIMYGLLGIAVDPDFASNRYVYAYYTAQPAGSSPAGDEPVNRVVRFKDVGGEGKEMTIILDNIPAYFGYHSGGALAFGKDGKLYISVGDGLQPQFSIDPNSLTGKVLRVNRDGTIPQDNPLPGSPVYAGGLRNVYSMAFDDRGTGLVVDNGELWYDEVNMLEKGANYGWPLLQPPNMPPEAAANPSAKPLVSYLYPIAPTQAVYYDHDRYPELKGKFLFGSYNNGRIYAVSISGNRVVEEIQIQPDLGLPIVGLTVSPDGEIYFGSHQIYKLTGIDYAERRTIVYPVNITPAGFDIKQVELLLRPQQQENRLVITPEPGGKSDDASAVIRVPRSLFANITAVEDRDGRALAYDVDDDDDDGSAAAAAGPPMHTVTVKGFDALRQGAAIHVVGERGH
ncbi:MAG: PQQ-dependent sugar dehydrogenase [Thermoproteota archaeon]